MEGARPLSDISVPTTDVAIVGGGIAGLVTAWQLTQAGQSVTLLEARARLGGRVFTERAAPTDPAPWLDLGPAWFWPHQRHMQTLAAHFALPVFDQYTAGLARFDQGPARAAESFDASAQTGQSLRLLGGTAALVNALEQAIGTEAATVWREATVTQLRAESDHVAFEGVQASPNGPQEFRGRARAVVLAAPPRVVARDIAFTPALPEAHRALWRDTVTWMGHAMKCVVTYATPFWREAGLSGYGVSWTGPLQEIHDASTPATDHAPALYAIMGFVAPVTSAERQLFRRATRDARRAAVLAQLARLFGAAAHDATGYAECDWSQEPHSSGPGDAVPPHAHPEYGHALFEGAGLPDAWQQRLVWAGAETSAIEGGYLDGAVASGLRAAAAVRRVFPQHPQ